MNIYVVQPGDTIEMIATNFGVSADQLIQSNEIVNPYNLVPGQTIVISYPKQIYIVQEGDTIPGIANTFGIPQIQLLRNNPSLAGREYINPGERLVIRYDVQREIITNGFAYPYINMHTLRKTLPYLTYLSVFNYTVMRRGEISTYYDDKEVIQTAIEFGTIPLMVLTILTPTGEQVLETTYDILLNEVYQQQHINNILSILREKGYYGINLVTGNINSSNLALFEIFFSNLSARLFEEGYQFFLTINATVDYSKGEVSFPVVDYARLQPYVSGFTFINLDWGYNEGPPLPITSYRAIKNHLDYTLDGINPSTTSIGLEVIGYDWELPYRPGISRANALTPTSAVTLALGAGVPILFDEISQTPFFYYTQQKYGTEVEHTVWFVNSVTLASILRLVEEYNLAGIAVWNIMIYSAQLWHIVNSSFLIVKYLPAI